MRRGFFTNALVLLRLILSHWCSLLNPLFFFCSIQGWYEPEVSDIVRIRALQTHGFGAFPIAVVFDKVHE